MIRLSIAAFAALALTGCSQGDAGSKSEVPPASGPGQAAQVTPAPVAATAPEKAALLATLPSPYDEADLDNGRRVFARCRSCHTITEGGPSMTGPNLYGMFGRATGAQPGYNYSTALRDAGFIWDGPQLDNWLENPRTFLRGTKMSFAGIASPKDRRDVIAFLKVETGYTPAL